MRILIDALSLIPDVTTSGVAYVCGLTRALSAVDGENQYLLLVSPECRNILGDLAQNFEFRVVRFDNRSRTKRILFEQFAVPVIARRWQADLVWFPANMMSLLLPWTGIPSALTIHDFSPGFYQKHFPAYMAAGRKRILSWLTAHSARCATAIIADSEFGRSEVHGYTGVGLEKIRMVVPGAPALVNRSLLNEDLATKYSLQRPYVLVVGRTNKHKNLERFIEAFAAIKRIHNIPQHLVIAGPEGSGHQDVVAAVNAASAEQFVHITGFIDQADLGRLYSGADLFAMPSLYEGFGFPVLEAMQHGVPCLISRAASLPEVAGDAAIYVDPYDVNSIKEALLKTLTDSSVRQLYGEKAAARAREFSWDTTAHQSLSAFRSIYKPQMPCTATR